MLCLRWRRRQYRHAHAVKQRLLQLLGEQVGQVVGGREVHKHEDTRSYPAADEVVPSADVLGAVIVDLVASKITNAVVVVEEWRGALHFNELREKVHETYNPSS